MCTTAENQKINGGRCLPRRQPIVQRLSLPELEARILAIRRAAAHHHISQAQWKQVDRWRHRAASLRKETV
jgi:hypothetical protein